MVMINNGVMRIIGAFRLRITTVAIDDECNGKIPRRSHWTRRAKVWA
jgi:hypothetical protein